MNVDDMELAKLTPREQQVYDAGQSRSDFLGWRSAFFQGTVFGAVALGGLLIFLQRIGQ